MGNFGLVGDRHHRQRVGTEAGSDDRQHALHVSELLGAGRRLFGIAGVVMRHQFDLLAFDATRLVDLGQGQFQAVFMADSVRRGVTGQWIDHRDRQFAFFVGGGSAATAAGCNHEEYYRKDQGQGAQVLGHENSSFIF